jgi:class 3 adenylate cyclase
MSVRVVPSEIIEVYPAVVAAFLRRVTDPPPTVGSGSPQLDAALRAIMFTDLKGSTAMTTRLGDTKALHLLQIHNSLTRNALREHTGREVKHLGDGIRRHTPTWRLMESMAFDRPAREYLESASLSEFA